MMILKEGCGCSDEQLYEQCRFNLLYRRALGMVTLDEQCPAIDSYYGFRRKICEYEEQKGVNLFDKCFKQITKAQAIEYRISGKAVREGERFNMKTGFQMYEDEFLERGRAEGKEIGRAEGKEIGRVEATRSVIQSALALNLPVEQIAQICSCGVDRVKQVQASLEKEATVQS